MNLTEVQLQFLTDEFGVNVTQFHEFKPLHLWQLREECIGIECDEAESSSNSPTERGNLAASIVDVVSSLLPKEWKRKTPPEVEAMYADELATGSIFANGRVAVAV